MINNQTHLILYVDIITHLHHGDLIDEAVMFLWMMNESVSMQLIITIVQLEEYSIEADTYHALMIY